MVMWSKDFGRSIDYLHTRPDIDKDRIGYFGYSWEQLSLRYCSLLNRECRSRC